LKIGSFFHVSFILKIVYLIQPLNTIKIDCYTKKTDKFEQKKQKAYRITDRLLLKLCIVKRNDYEIEIRLILIFKSMTETIKLTTVIIIKPIICGIIWFKVAL